MVTHSYQFKRRSYYNNCAVNTGSLFRFALIPHLTNKPRLMGPNGDFDISDYVTVVKVTCI